jgi:hypothetical protein
MDLSLTVVGVVEHSVDDGSQVFGDPYDEPPHGKLARCEMNLAARPNGHGRRPLEAQTGHVVVKPLATGMDPIPRGLGLLANPLGSTLGRLTFGQRIVDLLIGAA